MTQVQGDVGGGHRRLQSVDRHAVEDAHARLEVRGEARRVAQEARALGARHQQHAIVMTASEPRERAQDDVETFGRGRDAERADDGGAGCDLELLAQRAGGGAPVGRGRQRERCDADARQRPTLHDAIARCAAVNYDREARVDRALEERPGERRRSLAARLQRRRQALAASPQRVAQLFVVRGLAAGRERAVAHQVVEDVLVEHDDAGMSASVVVDLRVVPRVVAELVDRDAIVRRPVLVKAAQRQPTAQRCGTSLRGRA